MRRRNGRNPGTSVLQLGTVVMLVLSLGMAQLAIAKEDTGPRTPKDLAKECIHDGLNSLILGENKKAEEFFLKAKSIDPYSEQAHNFLGLLYLQEGLMDKAEDMLRRAIAIEPMYSEALRNLGKLFLQQENFPEAITFLRRTLAVNRNQPYTWYLLGMALYFSSNVEEAIKAYEEAFSQDPALPSEAHYNLAVAYHETSRYLDAVTEYEAVLRAEPEHINAMNNLGLVYSVIGEKDRAIDLFHRVLKAEPNNVKARINLGNVYLSTKDLVEAEKIYRSAISLDKNDISPRLNLGVVYFEQGNFDQAREEWELLLKDDPDNLRVLSVMGSAYLERKNMDDAIRIFKRMQPLVPDNGSIANTLGYLLADSNKELPLAKELIEKALESDKPNRATYLDSLAWVHYQKKQYQEARKIQEKALKIFRISHEPISSEVHLHMGKIYTKLQLEEQARVAFQDAIRANTDADAVQLASESLGALDAKK